MSASIVRDRALRARGRALLLALVGAVSLGACRGNMSAGQEGRALGSVVAPAAVSPQFIGSDPLPRAGYEGPRTRTPPPRPTGHKAPIPAVPAPDDL